MPPRLLGDPMLDRTMLVVMRLARELYVTRDRVRVLERLLVARNVLTPGQIDDYVPDDEESAQIAVERDGYIAEILEPLTASRVVD